MVRYEFATTNPPMIIAVATPVRQPNGSANTIADKIGTRQNGNPMNG